MMELSRYNNEIISSFAKRLLEYLQNQDINRYRELIDKLGIRR